MLKNKFGMTKVLVLVLSVLMLVSLAACNKNEGTVDPDAMNSAIQSAIDAANAAQAEKDAALASSIAADKAAQAERDAAIASSIAADKAAQEEELKKAQEAAAAASKQAYEASVAASKAAEEASKANTTVKTTKGDNTTAPIVIEDKTDALEAYSKLKTEYTVNKRNYYLTADYAELVLLFDKASVDLNNAQTLDAAKAVLETLKVDVAAIANAETAANEVQALIAALGDVETAVFTTAYEKVVEANEAFYQLLVDYEDYFDVEYDKNDAVESWNAKKVKDLGVIVSDLEKAEVKIDALEGFIATSLTEDMKALYGEFELDFDEEGDDLFLEDGKTLNAWYYTIADAYYKYLVLSVVNGGDVAAADLAVDWEYKVDEETGKTLKWEADMPQDHPWGLTYVAGAKVVDPEAPTAFFTTEEFIDIFATPYLNVELEAVKTEAVEDLKAATVDNGLRTVIYDAVQSNVKSYVVAANYDDYEDAMEAIYEGFEADLEELTFVGNYKGNATLADAKADIWSLYFNAYVDAANAIIENSKAYATELYNEAYEEDVENLENIYDLRGEAYEATYTQKLANLNSQKDAFLANVDAAPVYTVEELLVAELLDEYDVEFAADEDYFTDAAVNAKLITLVKKVYADAISENFKAHTSSQSGVLGEFVFDLSDALIKMRDRLDPTNLAEEASENVTVADLYRSSISKLGAQVFVDDASEFIGNKYYAKTNKFEALVTKIDETIAAMEALSADDETDEQRDIKIPTSERDDVKFQDYKNKGKTIYFQNEAAKLAVLEAAGDTHADLEAFVFAEITAKGKGEWENTAHFTVVKSDSTIPVQYTYTAVDKACAKAEELYNAIYTDVHALMLELHGFVGEYQKMIADGNVDKVLKNVAASEELTAQVNAVVDTYKGYISTYSALKYSYSTSAGKSDVYKDMYSYTDNLTKSGNHVTRKGAADAMSNTTKYLYNGIIDDAAEYVALFREIFFVQDPALIYAAAGYNGAVDSNVVALWEYKKAAVAEITAAMATFKNSYTPNAVQTGALPTYTFHAATQTNGYVYDGGRDNTYGSSSAKGAAYEAELDALLASYIDKINAVNLTAASAAEVKNALGTQILKKYDLKKYDMDGTLGTYTFATDAEGSYIWNATTNMFEAPAYGTYYYNIAKSAWVTVDPADVYLKYSVYNATENKYEDKYELLSKATLYTRATGTDNDAKQPYTYTEYDGAEFYGKYFVSKTNHLDANDKTYTEITQGSVYVITKADGTKGAFSSNDYVALAKSALFTYDETTEKYSAFTGSVTADDTVLYTILKDKDNNDVYVKLTVDKKDVVGDTVYVVPFGNYKRSDKATENFEIVAFDLAAAKQLVNAYIADLLGYDAFKAIEASNATITDDAAISAWGGYQTTDYTVKDLYVSTSSGSLKNMDSQVYAKYRLLIQELYSVLVLK